MLYEGNNPILQIIGVEHMCWEGGTFDVKAREYSALAFRISGNADIKCGGNEYHINTNDILYLPQSMGYNAEYTDTEMIVIHFVTMRDDSKIEVYTLQNGEQIYKLFLRALAFWENKDPGFDVYAMAQLYTILGTILENETKANLPKYFLKAISFINSNYKNNNINVDMICAKVGVGATTFRQLFKRYHQKTPTEYITALRLEYARNLISGGMPIENAAYESGFNDPKYFARVVKRHFGCTPRELKNYGR